MLDESVYDPCGGFEVAKFVCSPPMRAAEHRDALWSALAAGSIQQVSSDHAPFRYHDQKTTGRDNFTRIPNGLPGIETRLPLVFGGGVATGRISPQRFVELTSTAPARIFGLYPRKGTLDVGADADIIVVDPETETEIDAASSTPPSTTAPFRDAGERLSDVDALAGRDHRGSGRAGRGAGQGAPGRAPGHRPRRIAVSRAE